MDTTHGADKTSGILHISTKAREAKEAKARESPRGCGEKRVRARKETRAKAKAREKKVRVRDFREFAISAVTWANLGGLEIGGLSSVVRDEQDGWERVVPRRRKYGSMGDLCPVSCGQNHARGYHKVSEEFEEIKITADSGAVDHVAPPTLAKGTPVRETKASKQGVHYIAANGSEIKNLGEKCMKAPRSREPRSP